MEGTNIIPSVSGESKVEEVGVCGDKRNTRKNFTVKMIVSLKWWLQLLGLFMK